VKAARHLLEVDDLTAGELTEILDRSEVRRPPSVLAGSGAALLFEKPSARTRTSMEMAVVQLGGHPLTLRNEEVGIDTRESAEDLARLFSRMTAVIGARVFDHEKVERLAAAATVPVVNMLSDDAHPLQTLADLLTLRQHRGELEGAVVAYVGDANNVARSLAIGCALVGAELRISSPPGYSFEAEDLDRIAASGSAAVVVEDPRDAVVGADAVYTDAWYSMGQEAEMVRRREAFARWQVDEALMRLAGDSALFLHCLPAHRGDEATDEVLDGPRSGIWSQAENRMHTARGLLWWLTDQQVDVGAARRREDWERGT
jgi:ornithine carbamoyltransferase